jgi:hypothetical protein
LKCPNLCGQNLNPNPTVFWSLNMSHTRLLPAGNARDIYGQIIRQNIQKSAEVRKAREAAKEQKPRKQEMANTSSSFSGWVRIPGCTCAYCQAVSLSGSAQQASAQQTPWSSPLGIQYFYYPEPRPKLDAAKIAQLGQAVARKVPKPAERVPDMISCLIGWRGWGVKLHEDGLRLTGLGYNYI